MMSYGRGGTYADDYDDDSDSEDDPGPPPEGFSGIYVGDQGSDDDFSDDDDEPPPPPEGHMGVFGNGSGGGGMHFPPARNQFPPMHAQFPPTRAASASTSSTPGKGSARQWTEQQLAMQRRGVDSEANGSPGEYDDDDSSGDELEDGAGADAGSSGDEGGRPATASMSREDAQAAALGMTPSMKDGRLDALAESRTGIEGGAVEKPDFKREEAAPEKKKLGRWGTGGVDVDQTEKGTVRAIRRRQSPYPRQGGACRGRCRGGAARFRGRGGRGGGGGGGGERQASDATGGRSLRLGVQARGSQVQGVAQALLRLRAQSQTLHVRPNPSPSQSCLAPPSRPLSSLPP
jgi:hypothetical protein